MGVERLAPTPQFLDYVAEKYVILDQNKIDVESKASRKKLENQIKNIKENHLSHLDYKISQIQKVLLVVFTGVLANLLWVIRTMMVG